MTTYKQFVNEARNQQLKSENCDYESDRESKKEPKKKKKLS